MYTKNAWEKYQGAKLDTLMKFNEDYKNFITHSKTERLAVVNAIKEAEAKGFVEISKIKTLKPGDRVYFVNKKKNLNLFIMGTRKVSDGLRVLGAHIDSPRLDAKQNPIYESNDFCLLDTHYYGGIKKYQWVTIPLALYGVVCKKDGTVVDVAIGDDPKDPIVGISDLLPHLAQEQMAGKATDIIPGEKLDVTLGSIPTKKDKDAKASVKEHVLKLLKDKYDIEEEDFVSAEIEIVPSGPARDYGLDRSMVAGYGQDDRVCAYTSLRAVTDLKTIPEFTVCCQLVDKEEIGSVGATGAHSVFFENCVAELLELAGEGSGLALRKTLTNTKMLSSDVSAGYDPLFASVNAANNAAFLGMGLCFNKYTGSRGKSGSNDAMPEYIAEVRKCLDDADVNYQTAELGRVDLGGGGTIAYISGNLNMWVVDAGVAVLSMHAPMEITSKVDVYEAYLGYTAFITHLK